MKDRICEFECNIDDMTAEELAERLVCAYSIDREQAIRDVNKCLEKMNSHNLIEVKEM